MRKLKGYDSYNTLLLPPRNPGEKLPPELYEYFKEMKKSKEEQMRAKYLENLAQENGENSTWRTPGANHCLCPPELPLPWDQPISEYLPGAGQALSALCILFLTLTKWVVLSPFYRCIGWNTFCCH